jgi:flagellar biosynthesis/type III secretory pathway protein FliH
MEESEEIPDFLQEPWFADAIKELEGSNLSLDERASLEIAVARAASTRWYAEEQYAKFVKAHGEAIQIGMKEGKEIGFRQSIRNVLLKRPEWTDVYVSELLDAPISLVAEEREKLDPTF